MAGERLPARLSLLNQLWFRWTGKCFETATSHMQTLIYNLCKRCILTNIMKYTLLFIIVTTNIYGQNNFEPCPDIYTETLVHPLKKQFDKCASGQAILQIFKDHSLIGYDECLTLQLENNTFYLKYNLIDTNSNKEFETELDSTFAHDIHDLFIVALFHVEYRPVNYGIKDGTSYFLSTQFWGHQSELCGFTREVKSGHLLEFMEIIDDLIRLTKTKNTCEHDSLKKRILNLTARMNLRELILQRPELDELFQEDYEFFNK